MKRNINLNGEWELYYFVQDTLKINDPSELDKSGAPKIKAPFFVPATT